jgi:hypothetical protein
MLYVTAKGHKLQSYAFFYRKMIIKIEMFPEEVLLQMIKKKKNDG